MRKLLFGLLTLLLLFPLCGQNLRAIDSLLSQVDSNIPIKEEIDLYVQIAFEYSGADSVNSQEYIKRAIVLSDSLGYMEGKADALYVIGRNAMLRGHYQQAEEDLDQLRKLVDSIGYLKGQGSVLFSLGWLSYYRGAYEQSIHYHEESLALRYVLGNKVDLSSSLRGLGITHKLLGNFDEALQYLNESLNLELEANNKSGIAECLNHIGIIRGLRGDYPTSLDAHFEALDNQQVIDDKSGLAYTYQNIGFVHYRQNDFDKTLEYYQRSLDIRKEIGETRGIAQITSYMGEVYHEQLNYKKALEFYLEAMVIKERLGDKRGMADGYLNIGRLYSDQDSFRDAIWFLEKSLEIARKINSDWGIVNASVELGRAHLYLGELLPARQYLIKGIQLARASQLMESLREAAKLLGEVEKELGHYKEAYEAQVLYQQVSDSLSNEATTKRITLLEAEHEFKQVKDSIQFANEKEKLILDQKISFQRNTQIFYLIALTIMVALLGILYRYYRLKNDSNRRLSMLNNEINQQNETLKRLNDEKNNLINIVAHDLKNPLAGITGAVDLLRDDEWVEEQKELKGIIQKTSKRMSKMVTEILNIESIEKSIEEIRVQPHDLSATVETISNQLSEQASQKEIKVEQQIEKNLVGLVDERYIVQVIENLLSNALKFSPPKKTVLVKLYRLQDNLILEIKDEGPGLSKDDKKKLFQRFQRLSAKPTGNESSTGLGLSIVKSFVERMKGRVWVESELGHGASFFVELHVA